MRSSLVSWGNSFLAVSAYASKTLTMVLAKRFMYRFQISGSGHSSLETTSKHCASCVKMSTTEVEKRVCSLLLWNYCLIQNIQKAGYNRDCIIKETKKENIRLFSYPVLFVSLEGAV